MKSKIKLYQLKITDCNIRNRNFLRLYRIFRETLKPDMTFREFRFYYYNKNLQYIDVTFCYANRVLIGFCAAAFYDTEIKNKKIVLGRAATGISTSFQGKGLPKWSLYLKYMRYKFKNPLPSLILTAYAANPIIYSMICKYTAWVWPRLTQKAPEKIQSLKNEILKGSGLQGKEYAPFVVKIHFHVAIGNTLLERIYASKQKHLKYFLKINPKFQHQYGIVVIIPVSFLNIFFTIFRFTFWSISKPVLLANSFFTVKSNSFFTFIRQKMNKLLNVGTDDPYWMRRNFKQ